MILENRNSAIHLPYLDGWRGIAIICVLLGHFSNLLPMGGFGVSVFFVLSGFLMSRILFIEKLPLNIFYRRRLARIIPAFWLYLVVVFFGGWLFLSEFDLAEFLSTALFLRTYFPETSIFRSSVPIGHVWSLNVEEHCYMLLSLFSLLVVRFGEFPARMALTVSSILCVVFFVFYKYHPPVAQTWFINRTEVAALPLLLSCAIFLWAQKYSIKVSSAIPLLSFLGAFGIAVFSTSVLIKFVGISVLLAVSINTLAMAPKWTLSILSNPILRWFGVCSYSIYLWQQVFYFLGPYAKHWDYYNVFAVTLTLMTAACSFYFFEKPLRKWLTESPAKVMALRNSP